MKNLALIILPALALAGCSSTSNEQTETKETSKEVVHVVKSNKSKKDLGVKCRREVPTGSRIAKISCSTKEQRQARKQAANQVIGDVVNNQVGQLKGPIGGGGE